jgi:hypothetical protein
MLCLILAMHLTTATLPLAGEQDNPPRPQLMRSVITCNSGLYVLDFKDFIFGQDDAIPIKSLAYSIGGYGMKLEIGRWGVGVAIGDFELRLFLGDFYLKIPERLEVAWNSTGRYIDRIERKGRES